LDRPERRVEFDRVKDREIAKRSKDFALQHRPEIDPLLASIVESKALCVRRHDLELLDPIDMMCHAFSPLPQWFDLERCLTRLQAPPVVQQLRVMNFGPSLDQALLRARERAANAFDRIQGKRRDCVLVRGMEMRSVVRCGAPTSANMRMMIPKNRDSSGTAVTLHRPAFAVGGLTNWR